MDVEERKALEQEIKKAAVMNWRDPEEGGIQSEHVGATIWRCRMKKVHHVKMWIQISATFRKPG